MNLKRKVLSAALAGVLTFGSAGVADVLPTTVVAEAKSSKLAAPKNFKAKSKTSDSVTLSWSKVSGAKAYRIFKYDSAKKKWVKVKDVKKTTYTVENLEAGTKYKFKICALKKNSKGKYVKQTTSKAITVKTGEKTSTVDTTEYTVGAEEDFEYYENDTGITITKYNGKIKKLIIPDTIGGKEVTVLEGYKVKICLYRGLCEKCTGVVIPNSVTSIDWYAFDSCTSLTSVTIPDSVTSIDEGAFYGCTSLTSVTIPDSVTEIGMGAFYECTSLTSVTIPDSVTEIGGSAFSGTPFLTSIMKNGLAIVNNILIEADESITSATIPDSVTSIGDEAFWDCTSLTSITIPDSVTSIGWGAFCYCTNIKVTYKGKTYTYDNIDDLYNA